MRKFLALFAVFFLGVAVASFVFAVAVRHYFDNYSMDQEYRRVLKESEWEKTCLRMKIASLMLQMSPDLRDGRREILISRDGSVTVEGIKKAPCDVVVPREAAHQKN